MFDSLKFYQREAVRGPLSYHFIDEEIRPIKGRYLPTCGLFSFTSPRKGATHIGGSEDGQYNDCMLCGTEV